MIYYTASESVIVSSACEYQWGWGCGTGIVNIQHWESSYVWGGSIKLTVYGMWEEDENDFQENWGKISYIVWPS